MIIVVNIIFYRVNGPENNGSGILRSNSTQEITKSIKVKVWVKHLHKQIKRFI
jgi:hypothetical protein